MPLFWACRGNRRVLWQQAKDKSSQSVDQLYLKISDARTPSRSRSGAARVPKFAADSLQMQQNGSDPGTRPGRELDNAYPPAHCENMKNLTVSLDDETYRRARIIAAERDTSVSALVKRFLTELAAEESEFERLKRLESEARERIVHFSASDRLPRDEVYDSRR
jgi:predicted transcriptional regulator